MSKTLETLTTELEQANTALKSIPRTWSNKQAKDGKCYKCYKDETAKVMVLENRELCKEHFAYEIERVRKESEKRVKTLTEEIAFHEKLAKITRFSQIKDIVVAVRAVIQRERQHGYGEKRRFGEEELAQGKRLLQMLYKIKPRSSPFLDRGIAINKDLFLAGTVESDRYSAAASNITLTALDQDERYKAIARVHLTIGEAERLRNLLVDCIEHVRITKMIADVEEIMDIHIKADDGESEE